MPIENVPKHAKQDAFAPTTPDQIVQVFKTAPPAVRSRLLTQLVGKVYENATPKVRCLLLEKLLRPLGVLALVSVAGGIFANIRLRGGLQELPLGLDDVNSVSTSDVLALAERVQLASASAIHAVGDVIANSPMPASSAAASALLVLLINSRRRRHGDGFDA